MRALCVAVALSLSAGPVWANARMTLLMDALMMSDVVEILSAEGFAYAQDLNQDMLGGQGGAFWQGQIRQIYSGERITEQLRQALEKGLEPEEVEAALAFLQPKKAHVLSRWKTPHVGRCPIPRWKRPRVTYIPRLEVATIRFTSW